MALDNSADWYVFLGDETAMPAIFGLLEALPSAAHGFAFLELGEEQDRQSVATLAQLALEFRSRNGAASGPNDILARALAGFVFPPGKGQAITLGETSNIRVLRHALIERGFDRGQIYSEGYWRPDRIGGHDHINE